MSYYPAPDARAGKYAKQLIGLTNKTITPINLTVVCDHDIESLGASVAGTGAMLGGSRKTTSNGGSIGISSPAWTPTNPLLIVLNYNLDRSNPKEHDLTSCKVE
jgi:hypothetical protein